MNMLASLKPADDAKIDTEEKDNLGGGRGPLDTDAYPAKITMAYIGKSSGGAMSLNLVLETHDDQREIRSSIFVTSGDAKGNKTYYVDSKTQENKALPGFMLANSLCQLTTGKEIFALETEEKTIKLYSYDAKADIPTKVQAVMDLIGQDVIVGLFKQTVDKNKETAPGSKVYVATGETREENEIEKFFCAREGFERLTISEVKAKAAGAEVTEPFIDGWLAKFKGTVRNKAKGAAAAGTAGAPGAAAGAAGTPAGTAKPGKSLFGGS